MKLVLYPCGFLVSYYDGFINELKNNGIVFNSYLGLSGGAISSVTSCLDIDSKKIWNDIECDLWQDQKPGFVSRFFKREFKTRIVGNTAEQEILDKINGKVVIVAAKVPSFDLTYFTHFETVDDLRRKMMASSTLPYLMYPFPAKIKDDYYVDGWFGLFNRLNFHINSEKAIILRASPGFKVRMCKIGDHIWRVKILLPKMIWKIFRPTKEIMLDWFEEGKMAGQQFLDKYYMEIK